MKTTFRLGEDMDFVQPQEWTIDKLIPLGGLVGIGGASNVGKSIWTLDMTATIARGAKSKAVTWRGREIITWGSKFIWIAAEGAIGHKARVRTYEALHGVSLKDLGAHWCLQPLDLTDPEMVDQFLEAVNDQVEENALVGVLVIDALSYCMRGSDSDDATMRGVVEQLHRLRDTLSCTLFVIAHTGKDVARGLRGSNVLFAALDTEIMIRERRGVREAVVTKQRDGKVGEVFPFEVVEQTLLKTERGDSITSVVVQQIERPALELKEDLADEPRVQKAAQVGPRQKVVLEVVRELGEGATHDAVVTGATARLPAPRAGRRDSRRDHAHRAIRALLQSERIVQDGARLRVA